MRVRGQAEAYIDHPLRVNLQPREKIGVSRRKKLLARSAPAASTLCPRFLRSRDRQSGMKGRRRAVSRAVLSLRDDRAGESRQEIQPGLEVEVVQKADQRTGRKTRGT
jgi:uncharacterized protein DUF2196